MSSVVSWSFGDESGETEYRYVVDGIPGDCDTRHEAVGVRALYGAANAEVRVFRADYLCRPYDRPKHPGNEYYSDRDWLATTHGAARIHTESLVRFWDGNEQEVVEERFEAKCPVCYQTHTVDSTDVSEREARGELTDGLLGCCDIEWLPPTDWIEDCEVCGESHRERHGCRTLSQRTGDDRPDDLDRDFQCHDCGWTGHGETLDGMYCGKKCPECGSARLTEVSDSE